jgi:SAM-dependent methyltransferase
MDHTLSTKDADGYGMLDAADTYGYKNAYIDYIQKLALDNEGAFKPTDVVLDFGCGVGRLCSWLASRCSQVYGIDVRTELLGLASQHHAQANVIYQAYDGEVIPFSPAYFNTVLCVRVLNKRILPGEKFVRMLGELHRILKTPGDLLAIEHVYGREQSECYQREELLTNFACHGFICTSHYPIRKGHWPMLYLIRLGLISPSFFPRLAQYELEKRHHEREAYLDYKDYLFRFEKKG